MLAFHPGTRVSLCACATPPSPPPFFLLRAFFSIRTKQLGAPNLNVSYKPQKISPRFEGTVRQLLHKRIREAYIHPQVSKQCRQGASLRGRLLPVTTSLTRENGTKL